MIEDDLEQARNDIEHALRNVSKLVHPAIWMLLNDLSQEIDLQIEDDANDMTQAEFEAEMRRVNHPWCKDWDIQPVNK